MCRVRVTVDWKNETYRRHVCLTEEKEEGVLIVERRGGRGRGKGGQIRESREKKGGERLQFAEPRCETRQLSDGEEKKKKKEPSLAVLRHSTDESTFFFSPSFSFSSRRAIFLALFFSLSFFFFFFSLLSIRRIERAPIKFE